MSNLRALYISVIVCMFAITVSAETGLDDRDNPNDPIVNDRANACYDGGDMAGKCDTDWEWECGWYLIRVDAQNEESRAEFPAACISLLPELIESDVPMPDYPGANCVVWWSNPVVPVYQSSDFGGGNYLPYSHAGWMSNASGDCTGTSQTYVALAYAPGGLAIANAICQSHGHSYAEIRNTMNDVYVCV